MEKKRAKKTIGHLLKRYELYGTVADTFFESDPTPRFRYSNFYFLKPPVQVNLVRNLSEFVVFDTETTGLNELGNDLPFEITFIRFDLALKGLIKDTLTIRIDPAKYQDMFTYDNTEILSITGVDVTDKAFKEKCVSLEESAKQIVDFTRGIPCVFAHNGKFDANIVSNILRHAKIYPEKDVTVFDTVEMMDIIYNKMGKVLYPAKNLDFVLNCVLKDEIDEKARHTSEYDVKKTAKLMIFMKKFVMETEMSIRNDFARFDEYAKNPGMLGEELISLDNRYYELERQRKRLASGIRKHFIKNGNKTPDGWYLSLGKEGRSYMKAEYKCKVARYGYKLKRIDENGVVVPMYLERYGKDKESITHGLHAVEIDNDGILSALSEYDRIRRERDLVALDFKSIRKNAMKYMNTAENISKGFAPNEKRKHTVSDITFGNSGVFGKYEQIEDELDYVPNSDALISDIVTGKIQEFSDIFEKIEYTPDPVVWNID